jgi:hypothetical protein
MAVRSSSVELTLRGRVLAGLAALAAAAAWLADDPNARLAAALLAAPLVVDFVLKQRHLQRLEVRTGTRRTTAGAGYTEHVTLVHHGRGRVRECLFAEPRTMRSEPAALLPDLRPGTPQSVLLRQRSLHRSHVLERVFVAATAWPLGLLRARAVLVVTADLVTEPARVSLAPALLHAIAEQEAAPRDNTLQSGPEFHSLREHQLGEDARGVHALRSATLGQLVRTVTFGRMPRTVGLVLDLRRPPGRGLRHGGRRFEWSLGATATLVTLLRQRGAELEVLVVDAASTCLRVRGPAQVTELMTVLAEATPTLHRPLPAEVFDQMRRLEHCFWVPAGAYLAAPELAAMAAAVTVVGGDFE